MNKLKAELERKRKTLDEASMATAGQGSSSNSGEPSVKYIKYSEYDQLREASRSSSVASASLPGTPSLPKSPKPSTSTGPVAADTPSDSPAPPQIEEKFNVSNEECVRRLRSKGQPIRLFAESDRDRRARLRALELIDAHAKASGAGQRNDLMRAMEDMDRGQLLEQLARGGVDESTLKQLTAAQGSKQQQDREQGHPEQSIKDSKGKDKAKEDGSTIVDVKLAKTNPHKLYPQIYFALKVRCCPLHSISTMDLALLTAIQKVLKEWEQFMAERPDSVKSSTQGKLAAATQIQSADYLKPLFKALRKRDLEPDVLVLVAEITYRMQMRQYTKANDAYLKLSIGNAPWPIGVTMVSHLTLLHLVWSELMHMIRKQVGIHERSSREKIGANQANQVAHVLNDEVSRKYIQSLKRYATSSHL